MNKKNGFLIVDALAAACILVCTMVPAMVAVHRALAVYTRCCRQTVLLEVTQNEIEKWRGGYTHQDGQEAAYAQGKEKYTVRFFIQPVMEGWEKREVEVTNDAGETQHLYYLARKEKKG